MTEPKTNFEWGAADLIAARTGLGLSQVKLADETGWRQTRITDAEKGRRKIPAFVIEFLLAAEKLRDATVSRYLAQLAADPAAPLVAFESDDMPMEVSLAAAGIAAAAWSLETGDRPVVLIPEERDDA